ncbi:4'-phosphopantetheinyl transferase superfamily protein [Micromonospora sp. WMMD998]|uniref:4'-phosphopantetheinyl transferase family protein n=1 Tax=Micromonospora sp. WMMD998 TaxID=3016092 RepID=UPI00249BA04C|nr:4'-phosphopantetheinyl transferase superfamily protein [Micromonospora sp. WMMD998]WFE41160.1 4'-phosphopantetheinyl transferase superfamily protein [Micromonospora sp. WMMD998]
MRTREIVSGVWVAVGIEPASRRTPFGVATTGPGRPDAAGPTSTGAVGLGAVTPADRLAARGAPPWRARQILAGRALLRALLARVAPEAVDARVVASGNGKPALVGWPRLGVSVSHDGGRLAVGVASGRRIGVDVQAPPDPVAEPLLRRCAAPHLDRLAQLPRRQRDTAFAEIWTVQEACVKVDGSGIGGLPWTIDVPPDTDTGRWRGRRWQKVRGLTDLPVACAWDEEPR